MKKIILLPIKEPWATKIINHSKRIEFRNWKPSWEIGQEIWVISTGKSKMPREIIGSFDYDGYFYPDDENTPFTNEQIAEWGGNSETTGLIITNVIKFKKPLALSLFTKLTPQKYKNLFLDEKDYQTYKERAIRV